MKKENLIIISILILTLCVSCAPVDKDPSVIFFIIILWIICIGFPIYMHIKKKQSKKEKEIAKKEIEEEKSLNKNYELKLLDKNEVEEQIGSDDLNVKGLPLLTVKYFGGIELFDKLIENGKVEKKNSAIKIHNKGIEIIILKFLTSFRIALLSININYWTIENQKDIIGNKSKSVVGRALAGGILFGPVGAIVGGMTGLGKKRVTISGVDNIISISYNDMGKETLVLFSCKDNKLQKAFKGFKNSIIGNKFKNPSELIPDKQTETISEFSLVDELKKLKELLDEGILTKEEFDKQKQKLLNS